MKTKLNNRFIAREGLILIGVLFLTSVLSFMANNILESEYTIFNYECSYRGLIQRVDIVEVIKRPWDRCSLFPNFAKKNPQVIDENDKKSIEYGGCPDDFKVKNLPRGYSSRGLMKRIALNASLGIVFMYFLYILSRLYSFAKSLIKNNEKISIKVTLVNEGIVIIHSMFLSVLLYVICTVLILITPMSVPNPDSEFVINWIEFIPVFLIIFFIMEIIRFINWARKTLQEK